MFSGIEGATKSVAGIPSTGRKKEKRIEATWIIIQINLPSAPRGPDVRLSVM